MYTLCNKNEYECQYCNNSYSFNKFNIDLMISCTHLKDEEKLNILEQYENINNLNYNNVANLTHDIKLSNQAFDQVLYIIKENNMSYSFKSSGIPSTKNLIDILLKNRECDFRAEYNPNNLQVLKLTMIYNTDNINNKIFLEETNNKLLILEGNLNGSIYTKKEYLITNVELRDIYEIKESNSNLFRIVRFKYNILGYYGADENISIETIPKKDKNIEINTISKESNDINTNIMPKKCDNTNINIVNKNKKAEKEDYKIIYEEKSIDEEKNYIITDICEKLDKKIHLGIKLTKSAFNNLIEYYNDNNRSYDFFDEYDDEKYVFYSIFDDSVYDFYLQNATREDDNERIRLLMANDTDNENNKRFISNINNRVICLEGVNIDRQNFLVINIKLISNKVGRSSTKSILAKITFNIDKSIKNSCISDDIVKRIIKLPNAKELYHKIDNRINDWDSYLKIIEEKARESELTIKYKGYKQENLTSCVFIFNKFTREQKEKLKKFKNERVKLFYNKNINDSDIMIEDIIGTIEKIDDKKNIIIVELNSDFSELSMEGKLNFPSSANIQISKMGDLSQAINLRRGLEQLKKVNSLNPNLDVILFDTKTCIYNYNKEKIKLKKEDLLFHYSNEKQIKSVEGVLNSQDIYVIQGPPGTGKTTVIAEICYQNAIRGLKTLVASQTNLAVDNALGKLIHNPKIRALRAGNLSSVEKEGEKYTEENVVDTWFKKTSDSCKIYNKDKEKKLKLLELIYESIEKYYYVCKEIKVFENKINEIENKNKSLREDINNMNLEKEHINKIFDEIIELINKQWLNMKEDISLNRIEYLFDKLIKEYNVNIDTKTIEVSKEKLSKINQIKININYLELLNNKINIIYKKLNTGDYDYINILKKIRVNDILQINNNINELYILTDILIRNNNKIKSLNEDKYIVIKSKNIIEELREEYSLKDEVYNKLEYDYIDQLSISNYNKLANKLKVTKPFKLLYKLGLGLKWGEKILENLRLGDYYLDFINNQLIALNNKQIELKVKINELLLYLKNEIENKIIKLQRISSLEVEDLIFFIEYFEELKTFKENEIDNFIKNKNEILDRHKNEINLLEKDVELKNISKENYINNIKSTDDIKYNLYNFKNIDDIKYNSILKELSISIEEIKKYLNIAKEWVERIDKNKYGSKEELKRLYISLANVIGITCVQSGNKKFTEEYPNFDVVIVDEVSKATPPELILPLLKGKKVVLVGDHKQLPPMIGPDTFEELKKINESIDEDENQDLDYMKNSVFEDIYKQISPNNKIMLNTQYRMHSSIMNTINQFYMDNWNNGLVCGIKNQDIVRNHGLNLDYCSTNNHLLWIDIPMHYEYFEKQNSNNSYYNETEVEVVDKILYDINEDCKIKDIFREVAVITFYSAQSKLLEKTFVSTRKYEKLKLRVGTVDRFQGMEREIVIVSFVRNNQQNKIGFAKDPKRINVALSRAKSLLVIVGCRELFCENNFDKNTKSYYEKVYEIVDESNGIREAGQIFN